MTWNDKPKAGPGFDFVRLEDDGQTFTCVFPCEPYWKVTNIDGRKRIQAAFIVACNQQLKCFTLATRHAEEVQTRWIELSTFAVVVKRVGKTGSPLTKYDFATTPGTLKDHWVPSTANALSLESMCIAVDQWCDPSVDNSAGPNGAF